MKCECCNKRTAKAIIRTKDVCRVCYHILKQDNLKRVQDRKTIKANFKIIKETALYFKRVKGIEDFQIESK